MKTVKEIGSRTFWIVLSVMLIVFVALSGIVLICMNNTSNDVLSESSIITEEQSNSSIGQNQTDTSYEAVKERVDSINGNYGENVKAQYAGEKSTMQQWTERRMAIAVIKDVCFVGLIVLIILLVLTKGFGIALFRKKKKTEPVSENTEEKTAEKNPSEEPEAEPALCGEKEDFSESVEDAPEEEASEPKDEATASEDLEKSQDSDEEEVAESCKLS